MINKNTIEQFVAGSEKAFEQIFNEYSKGLYRIALGFYRNGAVAEEAIQESFVYLWDHRDKINASQDVLPYLVKSVKNYILNHCRHQNVIINHESEIVREYQNSYNDNDDEFYEMLERIKINLETFPESCRKTFIMVVLEGMSYQEAAYELNVSVNTVKTQIKIGYSKLRLSTGMVKNEAYTMLLLWMCC